jgi:hypothetical protein
MGKRCAAPSDAPPLKTQQQISRLKMKVPSTTRQSRSRQRGVGGHRQQPHGRPPRSPTAGGQSLQLSSHADKQFRRHLMLLRSNRANLEPPTVDTIPTTSSSSFNFSPEVERNFNRHVNNVRTNRSRAANNLVAHIQWKPRILGIRVEHVHELISPDHYIVIPLPGSEDQVLMVVRHHTKTSVDKMYVDQHHFSMSLLTAPAIHPIFVSSFTSGLWLLFSTIYNSFLEISNVDQNARPEIQFFLGHNEMDQPLHSGLFLLTEENRNRLIIQLLDQMLGKYHYFAKVCRSK